VWKGEERSIDAVVKKQNGEDAHAPSPFENFVLKP
jgi:hypothetical protein